MKIISVFLIVAGLLITARVADARGFGGCGRSEGSSSRGSYGSNGERSNTNGERSSEGQRSSYGSEGGRGNYGSNRGSQDQHSGNEYGNEQSAESSRGNYAGGGEESAYHSTETYHSSGTYQQYPKSMQGYQASGNVRLPTDAGCGASAAGMKSSGYAANRPTQTNNANAQAVNGAAMHNSNAATGTFNQNWYGSHPDAWHATAWSTGDEWHTTSWAAVTPALEMPAGVQPIPYNYGTPVPYQSNQVPTGNQPAAPPDQNYQQAANLAQNAPPSNPQSDWTPLGVFGLVRSDESSPHYIMQLAVNKSGALAGNYTDLVTNSDQTIQGSVDKKTQRVAWTVGDNKSTVGETGLYNLTQNEAPATIYVGGGKPQQWQLVRLAQSQQ